MPNTPNYDLEKPAHGSADWDVPLNSNMDKIDAHTHAGGSHNQIHAIDGADHTGDIETTQIANDAVTYAKIQNVSVTDRLLGRDTAAAGDVEELTVGGGIEFTGSGGVQRSALTGEVTAAAGSNATTVAATHSGSTHSAAADTHIADTSAAHAASAVSVDSTTLVGIGTDAQAVFEELDDAVAALRTPDYLVGTATGELSGEIVAGTTPGGELGGTWASPTVDATHSGSTHSAATDTHIADTSDAHDASAISIADAGNDFTATDVEGALDELQADNEAHVAAADPHTGYRLESADHTHQSTGAQAGTLDHGLALTGLTDNDHTQYVLHSIADAVGDLLVASGADAFSRLAKGSDGQVLQTDSAETNDLKWVNLFIPVEFSKAGTLTTGTGAHRWYNDTGRTLTFHSTRASVGTQPTGSSILIDVNKDGTTIFTTQASRPTIAVSTNTDQGAAPDVTTIADGSYLTVDIDQIGSTIAGADLVVQIFLKG
jgi:hypothetical protein